MTVMRYFLKGVLPVGLALLVFVALPAAYAQDTTVEETTKVHRLTNTKRAVYDAFTYVNRIPEKIDIRSGPTPKDFAGAIQSRLANQEGRIELKLPPGMDMVSYLAFKRFFIYEGTKNVGNCVSCHLPIEFTDGLKHVVSKGGSPIETPSLRNLDARNVDVEAALKNKIAMVRAKQAGEADEIDDEYSVINITEEDIPGFVKFLKTLNDGPESEFRSLILDSKVLDTSDIAFEVK